MIISLTGFMGCGKSSVGKKLSALLSLPLIDLDDYIEERERMTIPEIFASGGEEAFRQMEFTALSEIISATDNIILSLGGGTVTAPRCAEIVHRQTCCIYLRATTATLVQNLMAGGYSGRPLLNCTQSRENTPGYPETEEAHRIEEKTEALMSRRSAIYESTAHHIVDIDGKTPGAIAYEISRLQKTGKAING
ncbi:MAG: hypothetical protein K2O58_06940 [Bacteroidales bacterium]|nr:hypothetical protein [Bacteroidales bacterium]